MKSTECPVCSGESFFYLNDRSKKYYKCPTCKAIFMGQENHLRFDEEKTRYLKHNNEVNDPEYQNFVSPIVNNIMGKYPPCSKGLDFGSGTGPVITKLLRETGYDITTYDPFFDNNSEAVIQKYDFIACCEVVEHFHKPAREFALLRSLLSKNGALICMTELYNKDIDFSKWYYKNDPTHVCFYRKETFEWIRNRFAFCSLKINKRLIELSL